MEGVALKMLEYGPEECNLKQVEYFGNTALLFDRSNNMEEVALKITELLE